MSRAHELFAPGPDPRDPPLEPEFGIAFVLATANDVRKFIVANTAKNDQARRTGRNLLGQNPDATAAKA
jgi:hypothetical protein